MFERFTERARMAVVLAQDEARGLKHNYIGTEHLLLGLLREEEGVAARTLDSFDITQEEVRAHVARVVGQGERPATGQIPFTPRAKKTLEQAFRESLNLGHNYIGTEHVLLALVRDRNALAARILVDFGASAERVHAGVMQQLVGRPTPPSEQFAAAEPLAPGLVDELDRLRAEKEQAIEAQQFERASILRQREQKLRREAGVEELPPTFDDEMSFPRVVRTEPLLLSPLSMIVGAAILALGILIGWAIWG